MVKFEPLEIIRQIPGSWRLPIREDESITITFFPNGHFFMTISAYSSAKRTIQVLTGPDWQGNWHVRSQRRSSSSSSSSSSPFSSFSSFGKGSSNNPVSNLPGPYLVLNFTDLTKSILNFQLFGFRVDLANWFNNFCETIKDNNYRILDFDSEEMQLETPEKVKENWHRVSKTFA